MVRHIFGDPIPLRNYNASNKRSGNNPLFCGYYSISSFARVWYTKYHKKDEQQSCYYHHILFIGSSNDYSFIY